MTEEQAYQLLKLYRQMLDQTDVGCLKGSAEEGMLILDLPVITHEFDEADDRMLARIIAMHTLSTI